MTSPIDEDSAATIEWAPRRAETTVVDPELPNTIPTEPTEFAPRGRIIDDSARGTIFWEADPLTSDAQMTAEQPEEVTMPRTSIEGTSEVQAGNQSFGKPFRLEWLSTDRLPFYRTRGLRNPWNANREVKIARDGTELETSIGRRLIGMFHRPMPPQQIVGAMAQQAQMGYPPMGYR